jgi:hypothetical protein
MGPAENELSVRVVARDREIWGKTIVPVQGGWPRAPFYPLLALTVPADSAILVLQTVYVALWAPMLIPMILMR